MAFIKEFRGLRPDKDLAHLVAELPYDVIDSDKARQISQKNKYSIFHISKPESDFPEGINTYDEIVYQKGRENLDKFIDNNIFLQDNNPKLYLYTMVCEGREQTGLISCVHINDYLNNIIKKHELTRKEKEEDRIRHLDVLNANSGLVFLLYKEDYTTRSSFEEAKKIPVIYDFTTNDGIRHIFRVIDDKDLIDLFRNNFSNKTLYIADGHHRAASAVKVGLERKLNNPNHTGDEEYNWFLAILFPHDQLKILPYNRVINDLNGYSIETFFNKLKENYSIKKTDISFPGEKHIFNMYIEGQWYRLIPKCDIKKNGIESLDVNILQNTILDPLLGIKDPRKDKRIDFIGGSNTIEKLQKLVDSREVKIAFSMYPPSLEELFEISDLGGVMPPKSTWFEPKPRSGLVLHLL